MTNRQRKRMRRAARREEAKKLALEAPIHLKMSGYKTVDEYCKWWSEQHEQQKDMSKKNEYKGPKAITHDDMIELPWKWQMKRMKVGERKLETISSEDKKNKREMYVQGGKVFLTENGLTQKLTDFHRITIIDDNNKKFPDSTMQQIIDWTYDREQEVREAIAKQTRK